VQHPPLHSADDALHLNLIWYQLNHRGSNPGSATPSSVEKKNQSRVSTELLQRWTQRMDTKDGPLHLNHQQNWYCLKYSTTSRPLETNCEIAGDYNEEL
ncbi:hypothetical protein AVEN_213960-1, partial [Araneus ventricosus]